MTNKQKGLQYITSDIAKDFIMNYNGMERPLSKLAKLQWL